MNLLPPASHHVCCILSDTIITELETSLRADSTQPPQDTEHSSCEESYDDMAWNDKSVNEIFHGSQTDHQMYLNDSMTRLRQFTSADDASSANSKTAKLVCTIRKYQSQTADNPMAPRKRAGQPSRDTRKTN